MPSKPKTSCCETTLIERALVWAYYLDGLSYSDFKACTSYPKSTIASIFQRTKKLTNTNKFTSAQYSRASPKVDSRGERALIRHADRNTQDNLATFGTPSKSGKSLSRTLVRKILKQNSKGRQQARKKPYLTKKYKKSCFRKCKILRHVDPI